MAYAEPTPPVLLAMKGSRSTASVAKSSIASADLPDEPEELTGESKRRRLLLDAEVGTSFIGHR